MATGTCAICLREFAQGETFSIGGTEIFHPSCILSRGTEASIGNRRLRQLQAIEIELARKTRENDAASRNMQSASEKLSQLQQTIRDIQNHTRDMDGAITNWQRRHGTAIEELAAEREQTESLRAQIAELRARLANGNLPAQITPAVKETRDDTEIRFSLLELDSD